MVGASIWAAPCKCLSPTPTIKVANGPFPVFFFFLRARENPGVPDFRSPVSTSTPPRLPNHPGPWPSSTNAEAVELLLPGHLSDVEDLRKAMIPHTWPKLKRRYWRVAVGTARVSWTLITLALLVAVLRPSCSARFPSELLYSG